MFCSGGPQAGWGLTNTGDFQNMQSSTYWYDLEYPTFTDYAWNFYANICLQSATLKYTEFYAMAVRAGDVLAVPEPGRLVLAALALVGLGLRRRREVGGFGALSPEPVGARRYLNKATESPGS